MENPKKYVNHLELDMDTRAVGNERRYEMLQDILKKSTLLPRPVTYSDIDDAFKGWVEEKLKISYNNKVLPTMVMYSNQRFTEYSQTWQYTDENKNLILNFKTITRDNNPEYGHIQGGLWNIPGEDRFYFMKREIVLDDNGSESFLDLEMRQPMAIDLNYRVSIFTTNFETINEFNVLVNDQFKARQAYIAPNAHFMPMTLEGISDRSSYEIEDRQFYSQVFNIKVMAYIIKEDDFRVTERPIKRGVKFSGGILKKKTAKIEVEEYANPCNKPKEEIKDYYKPIFVTMRFPQCVKETEFELDIDFVLSDVHTENVRRYTIYADDEQVIGKNGRFDEGTRIKVSMVRLVAGKEAIVRLIGYDPRISYDVENDVPEIDSDETNEGTDYIIDA